MREQIKAALQAILKEVGPREVFAFAGLACMFYGLVQAYPPVAWFVLGVALFWLSIRRKPGGSE